METRKHPIEANETIGTVLQMTNGRRVMQESPVFGQAMTIARVLDELANDDIVTVLRINTETWAHEDITEYCARQYLYDLDASPAGLDLDDEPTFPAFVKNSRTWSLWKDDLEAERPIRITSDFAITERRDLVAAE